MHVRILSLLLALVFTSWSPSWAASWPASPNGAQGGAPAASGQTASSGQVPTSISAQPERVAIDARAAAKPFPHFWEQMFGSGRAVLTLRQDWRQDASLVKAATGFHYIRFHAILDDEIGVYDEDAQGEPVYNWSYVDQIYDGLLANGIRPYVELSFMPKKLAARLDYHPFWYHPIVSPPKSYEQWGALVQAFAQHLVDRYGLDEVAQWYFEVWNEPNIDFWTGRPQQQTYFQLYDAAARAIKAVSPRLRVGGPATAQAAWVDAMIAHAAHDNVPLDFVSTHVYGNDVAQDVFHAPHPVPPHGMVWAAVQHVHEQILQSARPQIPLIWSEFNATYMNEQAITDSIYEGPWMAETIARCDGLTAMMSYWDISDVFEEQGVIKTPFYGGYGLIAEDEIPKPAFRAFALLHQLGAERIANSTPGVLVTKREDGALVLALWNLVEPERSGNSGQTGPSRRLTLELAGVSPNAAASIDRLDAEHGDTLAAWKAMGSPRYPSRQQIDRLRAVATSPHSEPAQIEQGRLTVDLPPDGLAIVTVQ